MMSNLKRWPIAWRMAVSAMVLVMLVLPAAGGLLAWNFRQTMEASFNNQLASLLDAVISSVHYQSESDSLALRRDLVDPRFNRVFSGWYWQASAGRERVLTSRSLWDQRVLLADMPELSFQRIDGPRDQSLIMASRQITLPSLRQPVTVALAADAKDLEEDIERFQALLFASLAALGLLLLLFFGLQLFWGLAPLRRIERSLKAVESGERETLDTNLPEELARLARAINLVLEHDQALIERGRTTAGNLAHALKTPVAVLATLAERLPEAQRQEFSVELNRVNDAVRHHLARASAAGPAAIGSGLKLDQALAPVLNALSVLAQRRSIDLTVSIDAGVSARIEEQDAEEIVGNLLENALNWAETRVTLTITGGSAGVAILVEDDGPGMSGQQCQQALERGSQLDESRSGSGLGLAIVKDLASLYGATLELERSDLGGLRARVQFSPD